MNSKIKKTPKLLFVLLLIVSFAGILYNAVVFIKYGRKSGGENVTVIVRDGMSARQIGEMLEQKEIVASGKRFVLIAKLTSREKKIKAGRYVFKKTEGARSVLAKLVKGETKTLLVTIPEGLTIKEISVILEKSLGIDGKKFLRLASSKKYAANMGVTGKNLEGFLFPDTYEFNYGVTADEVAERVVKKFWKVFTDSRKIRAEKQGFTVNEIVTLASMIEEEAMLDREKPIISQVYHKRLKLDRALECDATVQYALPKHKSRLLYKDLKVKSPYNTYMHKGLPPGPISNPGKEAIIAALYPAKTNYLYYVAKGDGSHIFSLTAKEHQKAIRMLRNQ